MNVVHVTPAYYPATVYGGPITSLHGLCRELSRLDCEIRVLTTDANGRGRLPSSDHRRPVELAPGLSVRYCARSAGDAVALGLLRHLGPLVKWADVVHLTGVYSFPTIPALLAARITGKPLVWSPRGALQRWAGSSRRVEKRVWEHVCAGVLPRRTIFHVTSEDERHETAARFPGVTAAVIPNGVNVPRNPAHEPSETLRLAYLGRLDPKKGIENLLRACRILGDQSTFAWTLTIAGDGHSRYGVRLADDVSRLSLGGRVRMIGPVDTVARARLFSQADVVVVPSHTENYGLVVAEALAHGVPVIASTGTPWRRLEEMGCGFWVSNEPASLAEAIGRMYLAPRRAMGERGRGWMTQEYRWEVIAEAMRTCYRRLQAA